MVRVSCHCVRPLITSCRTLVSYSRPQALTPHLVHFTFVTDRCARGPTVVGPAALEAINLSAALPYVVELHEAREGCV